ncbi:MAG: hemerythrin domain-containing protein [Candidatus Thermoplasmatota archaeon]
MEVKEVTDILEDVYQENISVERAVEDMKLASPLDLALAEVELLDKETDETSLQGFREVVSDLYTKILEEKSREILKRVDEDHPLYHLIMEHEEINGFVEELSRFADGLKEEKTRIIRKKRLDNIENNVKEIKEHEKSEEEILFPRLEAEGFHGRVQIMKNEHDEIDELMDELIKLSEELAENKEEFLKKIDVLTYTFEFHAFIENNFLYPVAFQELDDWDDIKEEFEYIGFSDIRTIMKE